MLAYLMRPGNHSQDPILGEQLHFELRKLGSGNAAEVQAATQAVLRLIELGVDCNALDEGKTPLSTLFFALIGRDYRGRFYFIHKSNPKAINGFLERALDTVIPAIVQGGGDPWKGDTWSLFSKTQLGLHSLIEALADGSCQGKDKGPQGQNPLHELIHITSINCLDAWHHPDEPAAKKWIRWGNEADQYGDFPVHALWRKMTEMAAQGVLDENNIWHSLEVMEALSGAQVGLGLFWPKGDPELVEKMRATMSIPGRDGITPAALMCSPAIHEILLGRDKDAGTRWAGLAEEIVMESATAKVAGQEARRRL